MGGEVLVDWGAFSVSEPEDEEVSFASFWEEGDSVGVVVSVATLYFL